ncbi:xylulokinase [Echinimonas agarilytica]|uniref:Xylulose kinase n=1 Tax=Echinimonas agarilytica TaxID=1215918 RepID=A0AA42B678_9GAMM|nr:xylulokinase [Echinimonas agarilytica]MCM2678487.1 xylulokinase [Echinimonas agarilytica]
MYIGIDLGTSGVKAVLLDDNDQVVASHNVSLPISRPYPLWSEQNPEDWWNATLEAVDGLKESGQMAQVKAIGLSGQMHGATLLDAEQKVLRPAILWNDGRCAAECELIEQRVPEARSITGNIVMTGFTAPKVLWVQRHEANIFAQIDKVLLPKDYLRFKLTGDFASDMSDSAGTCWMDVGKRDWSNEMLAATGLNRSHMPKLCEGSDITGTLSAELAARWGCSQVGVVAGGGDNAAGAVGVGLTQPGQAMLSLGTSGVYFAVSDGFSANPDSAVHAFCHALPNTWHLMSVILSAASCLAWLDNATGKTGVPEMLDELDRFTPEPGDPFFLPYLSGERTPHNNPMAKGMFFGLTHETDRPAMARAVLEGVGFAFADGFDALHASGVKPDEVSLIGGGARSPGWRQMLASILNQTLVYRKGGDVGPALGAARLARLAMNPDTPIAEICPVPELVETHKPVVADVAAYQERRATFRKLYAKVEDLF